MSELPLVLNLLYVPLVDSTLPYSLPPVCLSFISRPLYFLKTVDQLWFCYFESCVLEEILTLCGDNSECIWIIIHHYIKKTYKIPNLISNCHLLVLWNIQKYFCQYIILCALCEVITQSKIQLCNETLRCRSNIIYEVSEVKKKTL